MPKKRLPAIADRAVSEKATKGRAETSWDSVVGKHGRACKGGNQEEILSIEKFGGYKTAVKERIERWPRLRVALRNKVKEEEPLLVKRCTGGQEKRQE